MIRSSPSVSAGVRNVEPSAETWKGVVVIGSQSMNGIIFPSMRICGAEFVVFAPNAETTFTRDSMASKSGNTPYLNQTLPGAIRQVVLGDRDILAGKEKSS